MPGIQLSNMGSICSQLLEVNMKSSSGYTVVGGGQTCDPGGEDQKYARGWK